VPYYDRQIRRTLQRVRREIERAIYTPLAELRGTAWVTPEPVPFAERTTGREIPVVLGQSWGKRWDCAWFHLTGEVSPSATGQDIVLLIDLSGEALVVDAEGAPLLGLTSAGTDHALGQQRKRVVPWAAPAAGGEPIDLWLDAGCNDLFGNYRDGGVIKEAHVAVLHEELRRLHYDFSVLHELMQLIPENRARHQRILGALHEATLQLSAYTDEEARRARAALAPELAKVGGTPSLRISAIGHAHIDLAWLWPLRETVRKGARTFATALAMLDRYPEYVFGASQPQLYQWMKERHPALYDRVKWAVAAGRWEPQGAMWVEADTNLTGGESLVRQILHGKRFFRREFGREARILWLPDVFGYSGALPQILKRAGVDYFVTIKLSWNEVDHFPHHTFVWQGIDGSRVLAHMPPQGDYNSTAAPRALLSTEETFADKRVSEQCLLLFGVGDGGGGPGEDHLEALRRERDLDGLPPVTQERAEQFFARIAGEADRYQTWIGELYLEKHQGTYTSQARNKRANRLLELALRELEITAALAGIAGGAAYPAQALDEIWKEALLYQFHDILPGSSITRVYDESLERYRQLLERTAALTAAARADLCATVDTAGMARPCVITNSLSWPRTEWIEVEGRWARVTVPPLGYAALDLAAAPPPEPVGLVATPDRLENELLRVSFGPDGAITGLYDKQHGREALAPGGAGNALALYDDAGDAWDFDHDYRRRPPARPALRLTEAWVDGPRAVVRQVSEVGASTIDQRIILMAGSRRLDFETRVDWRERGHMLRTSFPLAVAAPQATCEIQFGNLQRPTHANTSWDMARHEVCAHRWVDLAQADYGVALLNDCKYGHHLAPDALDLNLLRSPAYPDPVADRAEHTFTYALYPHAGDYRAGGVVRAGYELNVPLHAEVVAPSATLPSPAHGRGAGGEGHPRAGGEGRPSSASFLEVDASDVVVEAVKRAEDDDDLIVRLYEAHGAAARTRLHLAFPVAAVAAVNLLEEGPRPLLVVDGAVELTFSPFEIVTLKVTPGAAPA
jgi:alpha-mannosidase